MKNTSTRKIGTRDIFESVRAYFGRNITVLVCIVLVIICSFTSDKFLTIKNLMSIFRQNSVIVVLAIGASVAIIAGGIDASLASMMCFGIMVMGRVKDLPMILIILIVLAACFLMGTISGIAIAYFKVVPFIATMAMATIAEGAALLLNDGKPIYWGAQHAGFVEKFGLSSTGPVPNLVIGFVVLVIIGQLILSKTKLGFAWRSIGGNSQAAYWSGINTHRYTVLAYGTSSMIAGIAAIFLFARIGTSEPTAGLSWGMDALAAAVLGGTPIGGRGKGSIVGAILGAFILGMISNIFNLIGVSSHIQYIAKGVILFIAVIVGNFSFGQTRKKREKPAVE